MPYEYTDVDLDCDIISCIYNSTGSCDCDEDVSMLNENDPDCKFYRLEPSKEFIITNDLMKNFLKEIIDSYESVGIPYKEIEKDAMRLVLKTINNKSTLFRISKEEENNYYFFSAVKGNVEAIHNSIKEADLFTRKE